VVGDNTLSLECSAIDCDSVLVTGMKRMFHHISNQFAFFSLWIPFPMLNGLDYRSSSPAMALLIVFREENPMIVPAATLKELAAMPLTFEK
jgi:hypothetical protein